MALTCVMVVAGLVVVGTVVVAAEAAEETLNDRGASNMRRPGRRTFW